MPSLPTCHQGEAQPRAESSSARRWKGRGAQGRAGDSCCPAGRATERGYLASGRPPGTSAGQQGTALPRASCHPPAALPGVLILSSTCPARRGIGQQGLAARSAACVGEAPAGRAGPQLEGLRRRLIAAPRGEAPRCPPTAGEGHRGLDPTRTLQGGSRQSASSCGPDPAPTCFFFFFLIHLANL